MEIVQLKWEDKMEIQYKKIIKEIMGPEAKKRGYTISSHRKLLATRPMAYFNKEVNGRSAMLFEITEYLIGPKTLFLRCQGKQIHLKYDDEASFRECIQTFNKYMIEEGYDAIDKALTTKKPRFYDEDNFFVVKNYEDVYNSEKDAFAGKTTRESLKYIEGLLAELYDVSWEKAKPELLKIACILVGYMLDNNQKIYIGEGTTTDIYYLERKEGIKRYASEDPCNLVLLSYTQKDATKWFYDYIKEFYTEEELEQ